MAFSSNNDIEAALSIKMDVSKISSFSRIRVLLHKEVSNTRSVIGVFDQRMCVKETCCTMF